MDVGHFIATTILVIVMALCFADIMLRILRDQQTNDWAIVVFVACAVVIAQTF